MAVEVVECSACGFCGPVLYAHPGVRWWVLLLGLTGVGLVPMAISLLLQVHAVRRTCVGCGEAGHMQPGEQPAGPHELARWAQASALDAARFRATKRWVAVSLALWLVAVVLLLSYLVSDAAAFGTATNLTNG